MQVFTVGDFKAHFSEILECVRSGEQVGIAYGRKKEIVALLIPPSLQLGENRPLGLLKGKASVEFAADFKITEEEFLGV